MAYSPQDRNGRPQKRELSPEAKRQAYLLIVNSVILIFLYFIAMNLEVQVIAAGVLLPYPIYFGQIVYLAYWLAFGGFLIAYLIYNRGLSRKNVTPEMLPATWTREQREEYIADGKRRMERSRWMLSVIIPLLVTIAVDAIYLFTWPLIQNLFK